MKLSEKQADNFVNFIAALIVNVFAFSIASMFINISFGKICLYSFINSIWMTFLFFPFLPKLVKLFERKKYKLHPLENYIKRFEDRQSALAKEIESLEKTEEELLLKFKYDWKLYRKFLKNKNIKYLYHFTDKANIESIINNGGLFSWKHCNNKNFQVITGGNELSHKLDRLADLDNFVRLSFTPNHPMMYYAMNEGRIKRPVVLKLNIELIYWQDSKYSDSNATSKGSRIGDNFQSLSIIDFNILKSTDYLNAPQDKKKNFQAEVLVKGHIPLKYIDNIYEYKE